MDDFSVIANKFGSKKLPAGLENQLNKSKITHASASMMPIRLGKSSSEIPMMHKFKSNQPENDKNDEID